MLSTGFQPAAASTWVGQSPLPPCGRCHGSLWSGKMAGVNRPIMLYDADCGFCTKSAGQVPRLGVDVEIASLQESDLEALGVDDERAYREMPFVGRDGRVEYGHLAWAGILATGPLPARLLGRAFRTRLGGALASRAYHWVAANRHRLPGGSPSCALHPEPKS